MHSRLRPALLATVALLSAATLRSLEDAPEVADSPHAGHDGRSRVDFGDTADVAEATWTNTIGDPGLVPRRPAEAPGARLDLAHLVRPCDALRTPCWREK